MRGAREVGDGVDRTTHRRALEIAAEVIELDVADQAVRVDVLCADDPDLRTLVAALLEEDAAPKLLQTEAPNVAFDAPPPERIGAYRVDSRLGAGGMGVVYKAHRDDGRFERTVAIKFMNTGFVSTEMQDRFLTERQVTARLEHPHIARLLDGGEAEGRPYFVMEFIDGQPLEHDPERSITDTLQRFLEVCDAISYAHGNLVLHRDIKPGNIMLTSDGQANDSQAKVLDFGVAKIFDPDDNATQTVAVPMTKPYTSPECLVGAPATVRSDIYSLGVLLFELIKGERPYDLTDMSLIEAQAYLSSHRFDADSGAKDLDLIISQAMHPDLDRRYASVDLLAADIQHYLRREPISARGDDLGYVARKFATRNKGLVAALGFAITALVVGLVTTNILYIEAQQQTEVARVERDRAEEVVGFLASTLSETNPLESGRQEMSLGEILAIAKEQIEAGGLSDDAARAYVERSLSLVHDGRGEYEQAIEYARSAIERLERLGIEGQPLAVAYGYLGQSLINTDRYEEARQALEHSLALAAESPSQTVNTMASLGHAYELLTRNDDAERIYRAALAHADLHELSDQRSLAQPTNNLGRLLHNKRELDEAERFYARAAELLIDTPAERAMILGNIAGIQDDRENFAEAEVLYLEAVGLLDEALGPTHPQAIILRSSMINSLVRGEKIEAARTHADTVVAGIKESLPEKHFISAYALNVAGNAYCHGEFNPKGLDYAQTALDVRSELLPEGHWMIASAASLVGQCEIENGNAARAAELLEPAYNRLLEERGAADRHTLLASARLAEALGR